MSPQGGSEPEDRAFHDQVPNVQLGNKGGSITLLDKGGLKVFGVSYTAEQARREGWTVTF